MEAFEEIKKQLDSEYCTVAKAPAGGCEYTESM